MKLVISFSGGRTSGYMTKWLLENIAPLYDETIVTFAYTGQEHPATLDFVNACDTIFGFNTVWLEAVVHHGQRKGNTARVVTYETASRNGEPFEQAIKKHGIPNMTFPTCTRELKTTPMTNYLRSIGWASGDYVTAIGIRSDETRRVRKDQCEANIIYPLVDMHPVDKQDVLDWWSNQIFDLQIAEHHGNCTWCWKKSINKHMHVIHENPTAFDFPKRMEATYPLVGPDKPTTPRRFFRGFLSVDDMFEMYRGLDGVLPKIYKDSGNCSESCELYPTE